MKDFVTSFACGDQVILQSFNGTTKPSEDAKLSENYWLLIGAQGTIVKSWNQADFAVEGKRYLIQFDRDVVQLGLHCHNEVSNALWILETDLGAAR